MSTNVQYVYVYMFVCVRAFSYKIYRIFQFCGLQTKSPLPCAMLCCCFNRNSTNFLILTQTMSDCVIPNWKSKFSQQQSTRVRARADIHTVGSLLVKAAWFVVVVFRWISTRWIFWNLFDMNMGTSNKRHRARTPNCDFAMTNDITKFVYIHHDEW